MAGESPRVTKLGAVLLLLYCRDGELHMVFTKRTDKVAVHKGQISFPGGSVENYDDTLTDTALREATEELGVNLENAVIISRLDDVCARVSNFQIAPFVAFVEEQPAFNPDPFEVAEVFDVPLRYLLDALALGEQPDDSRCVPLWPEFRYNGHVIWGATGRILKQFLEKYRMGEIQLPDDNFALAGRMVRECESRGESKPVP